MQPIRDAATWAEVFTANDFVCEVCGAAVWEADPADVYVYCRVCGHGVDPADTP